MSKDGKLALRPKVRFSQNAESTDIECINLSQDEKCSENSDKPRIIDVRTLKKPVKVVYSDSIPTCTTTSVGSSAQSLKNVSEVKTSSDLNCDSDLSMEKCSESKESADSKKLHATTNSNPADIKKKSTKIDEPFLSHFQKKGTISSGRKKASMVSESTDSLSNKKPSISTSKSHTSMNKLFANGIKSPSAVLKNELPKGKITAESNDSVNIKHAAKSSINKCYSERVKNSKSESRSYNITSKNERVKPRDTKVSLSVQKMSQKPTVGPYLKNRKQTVKPSGSPVKKSILRNVNAPLTSAYIGSGVLKSKPENRQSASKIDQANFKLTIPSEDKLRQPKCNSILTTINKLREAQKENIVTDIEHLPPVYKALMNEKISAALEFPADEIIYKNLIDLTIDDKDLPSRVTRSKDPEPRQKDIEPKLSDFFTPEYGTEYCHAAKLDPKVSESFDNFSSFRISDKIFEWKRMLDRSC